MVDLGLLRCVGGARFPCLRHGDEVAECADEAQEDRAEGRGGAAGRRGFFAPGADQEHYQTAEAPAVGEHAIPEDHDLFHRHARSGSCLSGFCSVGDWLISGWQWFPQGRHLPALKHLALVLF